MKTLSLLVLLFAVFSQPLLAQEGSAQDMVRKEIDSGNSEISQLIKQKKYPEALLVAKRLSEVASSTFGTSSLEVARILLTQGFIKYLLNDPNTEQLLEKALKIYKSLPADKVEKEMIQPLEILSKIKNKKNRIDEAYQLLESATNLRAKLEGGSSEMVLGNLEELADIKYRQKKYETAYEIYRKIFDARISSSSIQRFALYRAFSRCSCSLHRFGKFKEAKLFEEFFTPKVFTQIPIDSREEDFTVRATKLPKPKYPIVAQALGNSGTVDVSVVVDENGSVVYACAKRVVADFDFGTYAEKAAWDARFEPTILDGKAVTIRGKIVYYFRN